MLEREQFNEIKQTGVGKDEEKVKNRVKELWLPLPKTQRNEILNVSGLTIHAVTRSYQNGKLSLKLALALAQSLKVNPYYLTGASDIREDFSDAIVNKFLDDNGHGGFVEGNRKPRRKNNRKPKNTNNSASEVTQAVIKVDDAAVACETINCSDTPIISDLSTTASESKTTRYDTMVSALQEKFRSITERELEKLNEMPLETAEQLLKGLNLRAEYNKEAATLASVVKLLLLM